MKVCERFREGNFKYKITVRDITPGGSEIDRFFDSLPDMLSDYDGDAHYEYLTPAQVKIEFQNKSAAMKFYKTLSKEYFDVKFYNIM